jgi:malonate transporter and related proteins
MINSHVFSLIIIIALGVWIEKNKLLGNQGYQVINTFSYYIALPLLIFLTLVTHSIPLEEYQRYSLAFVLSMLGLFTGVFCYFFLYQKNNSNLAALKGLGSSFPNSGFIGIPVLTALFGQTGLIVAAFSTILTLIPFSIVIVILEIHKCGLQTAVVDAARAIIKNPLLIAILSGLFISHYQITLPFFIINTCQLVGNAAIPCALLAIGQMLVIYKINSFSEIYSLAVIKLVLHPIVAFCLFYCLNVRPELIPMGVIIASLPTAVMQSILSCQYKCYESESVGLILLTTCLSFFSLPIVVYFCHLLLPRHI